jgi:outer membrane protein OmpA-like peptidoglycan-associated protein
VASAALADAPLPPWFPNPHAFDTRGSATYETYGDERFRLPRGKNDYDWVHLRGHLWEFRMFPPGDPGTWKSWSPKAAWDAIRPGLERAGFHQIFRNGDDRNFNVTMQKGQTYVQLDFRPDPHDSSGDIVEVGPNTIHVDLKPPAPRPETVGESQDFPYLPPIAGAKLHGHATAPSPLTINVAGEHGYRIAGTATMERTYLGPEGLGRWGLVTAYSEALRKAGWTIANENPQQGFLYAHYDRNGRDIWTYIHWPDKWWEIDVADAGSSLRADLAKGCRAALYGVNFDFDKATLRPDSEAPLNQLLSLLKDEPKLAVEIGGHTDNVGKADYNSTLSGKRAETVRQWLIAHGIAANRLTSHGYGDTQPLVPNNSEENRARNRRVEVKKANCR